MMQEYKLTHGRITHGKRSGGGKRRLRGSQNRSRAIRPLCSFAYPHFASPGLAAQARFRAGKTSLTYIVMCHKIMKFQ